MAYIDKAQSEEWETPQELFDVLDKEFHFNLDAAASETNAKCKVFFSKKNNAFRRPWYVFGSVFLNPPFGSGLHHWIQKAYSESRKGCVVVCILPARTDTRWFHNIVIPNAEIRFMKGRTEYTIDGNAGRCPFPTMLVIFGTDSKGTVNSFALKDELSKSYALFKTSTNDQLVFPVEEL